MEISSSNNPSSTNLPPSSDTKTTSNNLSIENATVDIYAKEDPETHKVSVFMAIFMAFYDSAKVKQDTALVQKQASEMVSNFTDKMIDLVRTMKFETLPASQENVKSPNMAIITKVNVNNTIVQAQINLQGDVNSMLQQKFSIKISETQATAQSISQSQNQVSAVLSLTTDLTKATIRG